MFRPDRLAPAVKVPLGQPPRTDVILAVVALLLLMSGNRASSSALLEACVSAAVALGLLVRAGAPFIDGCLGWNGTQWEIETSSDKRVFCLQERPQLLVMTSFLMLIRVNEPGSPVRWIWLWGAARGTARDGLLRRLRAAYFNRRQFSRKLQEHTVADPLSTLR